VIERKQDIAEGVGSKETGTPRRQNKSHSNKNGIKRTNWIAAPDIGSLLRTHISYQQNPVKKP